MAMSNNANIIQRIELLEKTVALLLHVEQPCIIIPNLPTKPTPTPKPKRSPSGYNLFCNAMRDDAKSTLSSENITLSPQHVLTELAAMWKSLAPDERTLWNIAASQHS